MARCKNNKAVSVPMIDINKWLYDEFVQVGKTTV
jgi:hypothetical protein